MPGVKNSKLKLLYLADIFKKETDEEHPMTSEELCNALLLHGITAERKSIYKDIDVLRDYGMDIILIPGKVNGGYFLGSREFELAELRLLSDAVQAAGFITKKKTKELVEKIEGFASDPQAKILHSQVYVDNRLKCRNEEIYYTISTLDEAITAEKKVTFLYNRRRVTPDFKAAREERTFVVSPYALIWSDDRYYLICNNEKYDNLMHVRLDRIRKVEVLEESARPFSEVSAYKNRFDAADYASRLFNMYSGDSKPTELICENDLLEQMLDRFGENVKLQKYDDGHFILHTDAVIGDGLAAWVMQYGSRVTVKAPNELIALIREKAKAILENY